MTAARFTNPPVREVSLTVLWEPLSGLLAADVGDLLGRLRSEYPKIAERPAMPPWADFQLPGSNSPDIVLVDQIRSSPDRLHQST
jgi:hypothetical protein